MLPQTGLLTDHELASVSEALSSLLADVLSGAAQPSAEDEDVHTAVERQLIERLGEDYL